jgi:putative polyhydroxyalkanoate system protein
VLDQPAMPKYQLDIPHALPLPEVRTRLQQATSQLESDYGAKCTWQGEETLLVARKGLTASVKLEPTRLHVDLDLGFLLAPMAGSIQSGITSKLTKLLA